MPKLETLNLSARGGDDMDRRPGGGGLVDGIVSQYSGMDLTKAKREQDYMANKMEVMRQSKFGKKRAGLLAAFVPDFVLLDEQKIPYQLTTEAVAFMVDVSGFTALTERYFSLKGKGGTEQLTKTLTSYMGPLAECILLAGGDIIKYAGDAFLAVWKVSNLLEYTSIIQMAIDCALYIQEKHGSFDTDVGITIRVKIGIGAGEVYQCGIGNSEYHHWVCFGPGVRSASEAESHCESGDVIVEKSAWNKVRPSYFKFATMSDGFIRIKDIIEFENPDIRGRPLGNQKKRLDQHIRPNIARAIETKSESFLRHYVIPPVLKKMDDDAPLEYLNESRHISICFIKVDVSEFDKGLPYGATMMSVVQLAFKTIYKMGTILQGCLTKIIMFDKGLTYLVVFGLPGYTHDNQSANALKFSYRLKAQLGALKHVSRVSIGVTSGASYCGVLGHPKRQEYTVIGRKINIAAREMCYYPGRVTCDQDTLYHSKLPDDHFSLMEYKKLKGIDSPGNIFEYVGAVSGDDQAVRHFDYPMVGRDGELKYFMTILAGAENEFNRFLQTHRLQGDVDMKLTKEVTATGLWILGFEGDNGIGKSRLLAACVQEAEKTGCRVYSVTMSVLTEAPRLYAIKSLTTQAFGMSGLRTPQEREEHLRKVVGEDVELASSLCLLNDFFKLKLPMHTRYQVDMSSRHFYSQHVLATLIRHFHPENMILFVIDDAHLMDQYSWEYLTYLSRNPTVIALVGIRRTETGLPRLPDEVTKILYHTPKVKSIRLSGLEPGCCLPLAAQMMEVAAVHTELLKLLVNKSKGVPAWIEQVLSEMLRNKLIKIVPNDANEIKRRGQKVTPVEPRLITKLEYISKKRSFDNWHEIADRGSLADIDVEDEGPAAPAATATRSVKRVQKESITAARRACVVKSDTNIGAAPVPGNLKEILLDRFDELNSNEQMLLKCATVLGLRFSRAMLVRLIPLYELNVKKYDLAFRRLMETTVIRCASKMSGSSSSNAEQSSKAVVCNCRFDSEERQLSKIEGDESIADKETESSTTPKYYNCKYMEFAKENMVEVIYELMMEEQRKELHLKAAKYLDASVLKCKTCSGDEPAYLFGITIKSGDLATDPEQALRDEFAASRRRSGRRTSRKQSTNSLHQNDSSSSRLRENRVMKGSFNTRMEGLKKIFQSSGSRFGDLEIDIMKALKDFDDANKSRKRRGGCLSCCFEPEESDEAKEWDLTITELSKEADKQRLANAEPKDSKDKEDNRSSTTTTASGDGSRQSGERERASGPELDIRGCDCSSLQAKIAVEMVKHYRNAEKYGKCLQNLVSAAEASITVGNSAQALVHLQDAVGLIQAINAKDLPPPAENDGDDTGIDEQTVNIQIEFLNGLSYFELGVPQRALDYFCRSLSLLGIEVPNEDDKKKRDRAISKASAKLWRRHSCTLFILLCGPSEDKDKPEDPTIAMKIRVLTYLHLLYRSERKSEMALLISLWQVIFAEDISGNIMDVIPSYGSLIETYASMSDHKKAKTYEMLVLDLVRDSFGSTEQGEPNGLLITANIFVSISSVRMLRGEIECAADAAFLALRIGQTLHDNTLCIHVFPLVIESLLFCLRISEVIESLRKLWYTSEEDDDWGGIAVYYTLCLDLLLNTAYPMEPFFTCEKFVESSDWNADIQLFREYEIQYNMEASLALWYARYSRWEGAQKWLDLAEAHKPKLVTFLSVSAELKLLECELIFVNHHLETKRFQHFAKSRNNAKAIMRSAKKSTQIVPVFLPRFLHLMGYYCQIRSRNKEAESYLKKAEKLASQHGNNLELEWITHNRMVWGDVAIPTLKFFWVEHTENHTLDWHQSGKVPWANIMYSLPLPTWK